MPHAVFSATNQPSHPDISTFGTHTAFLNRKLDSFRQMHVQETSYMNSKMTTGCLFVLALIGATPSATQAAPGGAGWQGKFTLNIPAGRGEQFFHYSCPAAFPVAASGGLSPNLAASLGMIVLTNGPRLDLSPTSYNEWAWFIVWPVSGAQAGTSISFDVYCVAGPA
jgi:hypothetical protein